MERFGQTREVWRPVEFEVFLRIEPGGTPDFSVLPKPFHELREVYENLNAAGRRPPGLRRSGFRTPRVAHGTVWAEPRSLASRRARCAGRPRTRRDARLLGSAQTVPLATRGVRKPERRRPAGRRPPGLRRSGFRTPRVAHGTVWAEPRSLASRRVRGLPAHRARRRCRASPASAAQ